MTVEQLQVIISAKTDPIQQKLKELDKSLGKLEKTTQTTTNKMTKSFNKSALSIDKMKLALIGIGIASAKAGKAIFSLGADAATVDNQVVALSKTMGSSSGDFMKWAQDVAVNFGISERAATSFGNQFSSIISRTEKNGAAVADLSQEYLKMGAIIAANTHFEVDDVMGRLRSGMSGRNEAIEDLGIEVKPGVIKGTEAYAAAVRDGGVAWEQMTDAQQANVRVQAIIEQAQKRYGIELQGTAGKLLVLRAAIDNMKLAWGRAFAPIVDFVIPILQNLVGWLITAANWAAALLSFFFKIERKGVNTAKSVNQAFGSGSNPYEDMSNSLDNANKSAKKLQRTLFGFDVIHNVAEPQDSPNVGGGGFGGFDPSDLEIDTSDVEKTNQYFADMNKRIEAIVENVGKITDGIKKWLPLVAAVVAGFAGLAAIKGLKKFQKNFKDMWEAAKSFSDLHIDVGTDYPKLVALMDKFPKLWSKDSWIFRPLVDTKALKKSFGDIGTFITTPFKNAWDTISGGFSGLWGSFTTFIKPLTSKIGEFATKLAAPFKKFGSWFMAKLSSLGGVLQAAFVKLSGWLQPLLAYFQPLTTAIQGVFTAFNPIVWVVLAIAALAAAIVQLWLTNEDFKNNVIKAWEGIKDTIQIFWDNVAKPIFDKLKTTFTTLWEEGLKPLWNRWVEAVDGMLTAIMDLWNESLKPIYDWFIITFGPAIAVVVDGLAKAFSVAFQIVSTVVMTAFTVIANIVQTIIGVIQGIIDFVVGVFTGDWDKAWGGVVKIFSSVFGGLKDIASNVWQSIIGMFTAGGSIFKGFATSVADVFKKLVNTLIKGINNVIGAPFKALNVALDKFKGIKILGMTPFSWLPTLPVPQIPQFAQGGFPEDGLFHANSRELVGKFSNGKTAVANNDQIISGVSTGVANAVRGVLGDGMKSDQPIHITVQIGAEQIAKEVINAVDNYTMRTGLTFKTI